MAGSSKTIPRALLAILADRKPHSGEVIASAMGCSRTAVWKHVSALREFGVEIHAAAGKGYCLAEPLELLEEKAIRAELTPETSAALVELELASVVGSTNDRLLERPVEERHGLAILAERQLKGRGRRGRRWISPFARNLYMSLGWQFECGASELGCLPLVVALAASDVLEQAGVKHPGVKWPNDLFWGGRKLGGCLVEVQGDASGPCTAVIGIGINVRMPRSTQEASAIDQPWTDLAETGVKLSRNQLAGRLLCALLQNIQQFSEHGFEPLRAAWEQRDVLTGNDAELDFAGGSIRGRVVGISSHGALRLQSAAGIGEYASGEVSIRHKDS